MKRPWKIAIKLVLLLLLGAIVNVAVAWGCSVTINPYHGDWKKQLAGHGRIAGFVVTERRLPGCQVFSVHSSAGMHPPPRRGPQYPTVEELLPQWADEASLRDHMLHVHDARGWPCLALYAALEAEQSINYSFQLHHAIETSVLPFSSGWRKIPRVLPLRPIWPGFAINTIFYAVVLWVLFAAPGVVKRRIRRFRGRCLHCGYELRGQPADSKKCPECGRSSNCAHRS